MYSVDNRIAVVRASQQRMQRSVRKRQVFQTACVQLMQHTYGSDLTVLKEGINDMVDTDTNDDATNVFDHVGDLTQLVYRNRNRVEQAELLQHIAIQALECNQSMRIISDIDDTLYAGWMDKRYPMHVLYPGVHRLHQAISNHHASLPATVFLTARPRGWLSVGKKFTSRHLVKLGIPSPTVLPGAVKGLTSNRNIAT